MMRRDAHPDNDGEEGPAAGGQVDVRIQEVLVQVRVGQQREFGQNSRHLQVHVIRLQDRRTSALTTGLNGWVTVQRHVLVSREG